MRAAVDDELMRYFILSAMLLAFAALLPGCMTRYRCNSRVDDVIETCGGYMDKLGLLCKDALAKEKRKCLGMP